MTMNTKVQKSMGRRKNSSKREVHSDTDFLYHCITRLDAWDMRSDLVHWENLGGAGGEGGGRGDREGEHM